MKGKVKKPSLLARVPGKVNNRTVVRVIDRLRKIEKVIKRNFSQNDLLNRQAYAARLQSGKGFINGLIERQAEFTDMSLGKSTLDYSGCEVIAVYNLLWKYRGGELAAPLSELIEIFEADGILYAGRFGVSPKAICEYLADLGIEVSSTTEEGDFDVIGSFCDHFILTVMNDRDNILRQVHTFYISKEKGNFISHNAGLRMRYHSVSEVIGALPEGRAKGIFLIGVKEP